MAAVNKERINYFRLCRAIVDLCTDVFRDILRSRINPTDFLTELRKCADIRHSDLLDIAKVVGAGSYNDFDISMLYQVLRSIFTQDLRDALKTNIDPSQINTAVQNCSTLSSFLTPGDVTAINKSVTKKSYDNLKDELLWTLYGELCKASPVTNFVHPSKSWGQTPDHGAINLGDDIERIRILRNTVVGHKSKAQIKDVDFRKHWSSLSDVIIRMDHYLQSGYKKSLDDIEVSSLDREAEEKYLEHIRKLKKNISDLYELTGDVTGLKTQVATVTETQDKMAGDVMGLKTEVTKVTETQDKMAEDVTGLKFEVTKVTETQDKMAEDVTGLKTEVTKVTETHDKMNADFTGLKTEVTKVTETQDKMAGGVTGLKTEVTKVTESQNKMAEDVTGLKFEVTKVTETQDKMAEDVTGLKNEVTKVTETQDKMAEDVTRLKTEVTEVTETQDKMAGDVTGLETEVTKVTETHDKINADVTGLKTELTKVTETQDKMAGDVTGLKTEVTKVTKTQDKMAGDVTGIKTVVIKVTETQDKMAGDVTGLKTEVTKVTETQDKMAGDVTELKTEVTKVTETQDKMAGNVVELKTEVHTIAESQKELAENFLQLKKDPVPDPVPKHLRSRLESSSGVLHFCQDFISNIDVISSELAETTTILLASDLTNFLTCPKQYSETLKEWEDEDKVFTETKACVNVRKAIKQNTFVTVSGNGGSGKSAMIHHIALEYKSKGFDVLPVEVPDDIKKYLDVDKKQLFVYDDPLGVHCMNRDKFIKWLDVKIGSAEMQKNMKVVCSVRRLIVNEPDFKTQRNTLNRMVVDIEDDNNRLSLTEKVKMIKKHMGERKIELIITENDKKIIKNQKESFPLACKIFVSSDQLSKINDWTFFQNPFKLILEDLEDLRLRDKVKYCILILCLISKNGLNPELYSPFCTCELTKENPFILACGLTRQSLLTRFKNGYESLLNVYLKWENGILSFSHDLISDVIAYNFGQNYPNEILEHFPFEFVSRRVIVGEFEENDPYIIRLETENINSLVDRMLKELKNREFKHVFMNKSWRNDSFLEAFKKQIVNESGQFCHGILGIFTETQKTNENIISELKQIEYNALSSWTWYFKAMFLLKFPGVTALHWIAAFGHTNLFIFIWKNLASFQKYSVGKEIPLLHLACLGGDREIFNMVLQTESYKVNTPFTPDYDIYPIHLAVFKNEDIFEDLIHLGADINVKNSAGGGRTTLFYAAACNNLKVCNRIVQSGYVSGPCECSCCTLDTYKEREITSTSTSKLSIDHLDKNWCSPLHVSAQNNSADVCRLLLEYKADPNLCDKDGCSPLYISAQNNSANVAKMLLKYKADVNLCEADGCSPLYISAQNNNADVSRLLLENNADPNLCENNRCSPLFISAQNNSADVAKLLLEYNADPNLCMKFGCSPLYISAHSNSADVAKLLLDWKADPNLYNKNGCTPLYISAYNNSADVAKLLLKDKADPNLCGNNRCSPLYIAAQNKSADVAKLLLENKADPNLCDEDDCSPLFMVAQNNSADIAKLLLDWKADPNLRDKEGHSPLHGSAQANSVDVAKLLLKDKADPNLCDNYGCSPLYIAAENKSADVAKLLVENKADLNLCNKDGHSPLIISAINDSADVAKMLLENKVDPNLRDKEGHSPLHGSAQANSVDVAKLLLEYKADPNLRSSLGLSPLYMSAQNNSADVAKLLLEYDADPNLCENKGWSPLHISAGKNSADVAKLLLEYKANPNFCFINGCSPLFISAEYNSPDVAKLLLDYNADPNLCSNKGISPLYVSAEKNCADVAKLLLEHGANPNLCDEDGCSPLHASADENSADVTKLLLQYNADLNLCDKDGMTPLYISTEKNSTDVTMLILEYEADIN